MLSNCYDGSASYGMLMFHTPSIKRLTSAAKADLNRTFRLALLSRTVFDAEHDDARG